MKIEKKGEIFVAKCYTCRKELKSSHIIDIKWRIRMHDAEHTQKLSKWIKND